MTKTTEFFSTYLIFAFLLAASSVFANALSDGNGAYKAHDYNTALTDYQMAASQLSGIQQAKAYWKEGFTYEKLKQFDKAVDSFNHAKQIDPSLSFTSSPDKFNEAIASAQSHLTSAAPTQTFNTATTTTNTPTGDPAAIALSSQNVYVDPLLAAQVSATGLEEAAQGDNEIPLKIAVLDRLPSTAPKAHSQDGQLVPDLAAYTRQLHDYVNLGSGAIIVVAAHGPGAGVWDTYGTKDSASQTANEKALAQKYVAQIGKGDYNGGITALANDVTNSARNASHATSNILLTIFLVVVIIVCIFLVFASQGKKAQLSSMRGPIETLKGNVLAGIEYLDNYIDVLPKNNADSDQVRAFRQAAAAKLDQASKIISRSTEISDLSRAQLLLDKAATDVQNGRAYLDRATGGTGNIPGDSGVRPVPLPTNQSQVQQIPDEQRGVSFFSSRPAPLSQLVPITLNIDGQQKTVMGTIDEAEQVRRGQIPPIRSFNVGGQSVPWYAYQNYDPYDDYWTYQNNGWRGVAGGAIAGFLGAELLNSLFAPRPYWGGGWYSPYAYGPGWDSWGGWGGYDGGFYGGMGWNDYGIGYDQGFMQGEREQRMDDYGIQNQPYDINFDNGSTGVGFMGGGGVGGYDQSDYGSSGAGFMGGDRS